MLNVTVCVPGANGFTLIVAYTHSIFAIVNVSKDADGCVSLPCNTILTVRGPRSETRLPEAIRDDVRVYLSAICMHAGHKRLHANNGKCGVGV